MMKNRHKKTLIFLMLATFCLGAPFWTQAKKIEISIDQTMFALEAEPGETHNFKLNVANNSDEAQKIQVFAQDYDLEKNNRLIFREQRDLARGISAWISVNKDDANLTLNYGEKREIKFTLKIPPEAEVGSHRGAVLVGTVPQEFTGEFNEALLSGRIGAHILVNVAGEKYGSGKIYSFRRPFLFWEKMLIAMDFENTGNVHYIPHGELLIQNLFTKNEEKINLEKHFVFPGENYLFEEEWTKGSPFGIYSVRAAFVDGDGAVHVETGYSLGIFFLPTAVALIFGMYLAWKKWKKLGSRNKNP